MPSWLSSIVLLLALGLSGCAAFRSYDQELYSTLDQASRGSIDTAIRLLEANNRLPDKDLLYYLELGMLQRLAQRYPESQKTWSVAQKRLQSQSLVADVAGFMGTAASYVVNDKLRPYLGHDYEKVLLSTYVALNHLAQGDYDAARVAIRQTHELEAQIAGQRAKQIAEVEEQAKKRGATTSIRELNGYPVETIDNPQVNALKNSYQSALSHYLAGFVYEALGEGSLAAPGYRLANELQPNQPLLEEALRELDQRLLLPDDGKTTDVLFILESGTAPALRSRQFRFLALGHRSAVVAMSFPVMQAVDGTQRPVFVSIGDGRRFDVAPLTSVDLMARRSLRDDMPGIMLRAALRSTTSVVTQVQAQRLGDSRDPAAQMIGLAALVVGAGSAIMDSADDRTWRSLPADISIARARLPRGAHTVTVATPDGQRSAEVRVGGRYAVVDLRLLRQRMYVHAPSVPAPGIDREGTK